MKNVTLKPVKNLFNQRRDRFLGVEIGSRYRDISIKIVIAPGGGFKENAGEMITSVSCPQAF